MNFLRVCPLVAVFMAVSARLLAAPNIIFVLADDLGYGDLGCFYQNGRPAGSMKITTPEIDRMAGEGLMMTHHYTGAPVCVTARASLLTGLHTGHCPIRDNQFDLPLPTDGLNMARMLKASGYRTSCIGKWGMAGQAPTFTGHPLLHGFDEFYGILLHSQTVDHYPGNNGSIIDMNTPVTSGLDGIYIPDLLTARAKRFIVDQVQNRPSEPFFLYLPHTLPHWHLRYAPAAYPAGRGLTGGLQWPLTASGTPDTFVPPDIAAGVYDHDNNPATAMVSWPDNAKRHASMVRRLDESMGDLLQLLHDLGIANNTLVVLTSDNGPDSQYGVDPRHFDSWGPLDGVKGDVWEGGIRVPTVAWWPGNVPAGNTSITPCAFWDWMPTFAELAGVAPPARDGMSLVPALTELGVQQRRPHLYWEFYAPNSAPIQRFITERKPTRSAVGEMQAIRIGNYTGVRYQIEDEFTPLFLYNVVTDPHQDVDLSDHPAFRPTLREMHRLLRGSRMRSPFIPRNYDGAAAQTVGTPLETGLDYRAFEGSWPWIPDFRYMTPVATGVVSSLTPMVATRDTDCGIQFTGYLNVPKTADYRFILNASGGGFLWIHDANVVFNARPPDGAPCEGNIRLEAGLHPFRLHFRHNSGPPVLQLRHAMDNGPVSSVPSSWFFRTMTPDLVPMTFPDQAQTPMNTPASIDVLANDLNDGLPQPIHLVSVGPAARGTTSVDLQTVLYTPADGFLGEDGFSYVVSDGAVLATGRVDVTVTSLYVSEWWLPLEEGGGNLLHESGGEEIGHTYGYDIHNGWEAGRIGTALRFDGMDDTAYITDRSPPLGASPRTISAWVRVPASGGGPIFGYGATAAGQAWILRIQNDAGAARPGALRVEVDGGFLAGTRDLRDDQWHHVACVLPDSAAPDVIQTLLYIDGLPETISSSFARTVNTAPGIVYLGSDPRRRLFSGVIDELRVYPRALPPAEVQLLARGVSDRMKLWKRRYLPPDESEWGGDADKDGVPNIWEFVTGTSPFEPEARADAWLIQGGYLLSLRCVNDPGIRIRAELSESLTDWSNPLLLESASQVPDPDNLTFRRLNFQIPEGVERAYLRFTAEPEP